MIDHNPTTDDLDEFNYRSNARRLGRKYYDNKLDDNREIHNFIAHYSNLLLQNALTYDGEVTTTQHNEKVIVTVPHQRNPGYDNTLLVKLREELHYAPHNKRNYVNKFRDVLARFIVSIAEHAISVAQNWEQRQMQCSSIAAE